MNDFMKNIREMLARILRCKCLDESELRAIIDHYTKIGYDKGYTQCKKDYGIDTVSKHSQSHSHGVKVQPQIDRVILFVKADRGNMIIDDIRRGNHLSEQMSENLYEVTQKMWVGDSESFERNKDLQNLFNAKGEKSEFGPEYDSVAVMVELAKPVQMRLSDSFERHEFIKFICKSKALCIAMSQRLPLNQIENIKAIDIQ